MSLPPDSIKAANPPGTSSTPLPKKEEFIARYPEVNFFFFMAVSLAAGYNCSGEYAKYKLIFVALAVLMAGLTALCLLGRGFLRFPRLMLFLALATAYHTFGASVFVYLGLAIWAMALR